MVKCHGGKTYQKFILDSINFVAKIDVVIVWAVNNSHIIVMAIAQTN